jgi:hypothetical protein
MKFAATIIALAGLTQIAYATTYAQFCNDQECSDGCGNFWSPSCSP